ncbi:hypothetical protein SISNIDRAFT_484481 [Sistotremastrum niveocremeum HHB9708]|uniref:Uncharacterized protein n=1 Tax=Sistotremastrum niveocremeum HHB9708 TaxID=1314777 RepID=A0A164WDV7_9AGAM|nr:hypothetical protein SISNIDRAFT_484481 [Sistotremastrum niveocremeum HHB9708]
MPSIVLVGHHTQSRSDSEIMHKAFTNGRGETGPILPEEGERAAREMGAVKYMECDTGNAVHLNYIIREVLRIGWNDVQVQLAGSSLYRTVHRYASRRSAISSGILDG